MTNKKTSASYLFPKNVGFLSPEEAGVLSPEVTGIDRWIQAFLVDVWEGRQERVRHLVVSAHYPEMDRNLCEQLGARLIEHFGDVIVSFTVRIEPGIAVFFIPLQQQDKYSLESVASATVVVASSCWWDECERVRVYSEITGESIEVKLPLYDNNQFEMELYS